MMRITFKYLSLAALALTVLPSLLVLYEWISWTLHSQLMLLGMLVWFATAPFWIRME